MKFGNDNRRKKFSKDQKDRLIVDTYDVVLSLCISDSEGTKDIRKYLRDRYTINENITKRINGETVDAYIMDIECFEKNKKHLMELREIYGSDIHPVLVLMPRDADIDCFPDVWDLADDIIKYPTHNRYLKARLDLMLRYRNMSRSFTGIRNRLEDNQHQLIKEKKFLFDAADKISGIVFVIDEENRFKHLNSKFEEDLGLLRENVKKMSFLDLFEEDSRDRINLKLNEARCNGSTEFTANVYTEKGEKRVYFFTASVLIKDGNESIIGSGTDITKRLEAEFKSKQHEQLMEAIINQSQSVIYVKDDKGNMKLVNKAFLDVFGLKRAELNQTNDYDLLDDAVVDQIRKNDLKVLRADRPLEFEEYIEVDNRPRYFQTIKYPLKRVPGYENHICGISTEITDKKKLIIDLEDSNRGKKTLLQITRLIESYDDAYKILNVSVDAIPQAFKYYDKCYAKIKFGDKEYYSRGYKKGNIIRTSKLHYVKNQPLEVVIEKEVMDDTQNDKSHIVEEQEFIDSICQSISSRLNRLTNLQELNESEQRWENLVQNDPDLVMIIQDGVIRFMNKAGAAMYGSTAEQMIGLDLFNSVELDNLGAAFERIKQVLGGQKVGPRTYRIRHPENGRVRHLKVQSLPIDHQGAPAVQVVGTDVTELVNKETELKDLLKEKEVLLQEIHHRVKNNLAVVSSFFQLKLLSSDEPVLIDILKKSVTRIKSIALVHEKLYQQHSLSAIDFKDYLKDLISHIYETWDNGFEMNIDFKCDSVMLNVNQAVPCALIINEILTNSFKHALKGNENGKIIIKVSEEGNLVKVEIQDNGPGYPDNFLEKNESMGTTLLKTLCDQLMAELTVENSDGACTRFSFVSQKIKGSVSHYDV